MATEAKISAGLKAQQGTGDAPQDSAVMAPSNQIDFTGLSVSDLQEMMNTPGINPDVLGAILAAIGAKKTEEQDDDAKKATQSIANTTAYRENREKEDEDHQNFQQMASNIQAAQQQFNQQMEEYDKQVSNIFEDVKNGKMSAEDGLIKLDKTGDDEWKLVEKTTVKLPDGTQYLLDAKGNWIQVQGDSKNLTKTVVTDPQKIQTINKAADAQRARGELVGTIDPVDKIIAQRKYFIDRFQPDQAKDEKLENSANAQPIKETSSVSETKANAGELMAAINKGEEDSSDFAEYPTKSSSFAKGLDADQKDDPGLRSIFAIATKVPPVSVPLEMVQASQDYKTDPINPIIINSKQNAFTV